MCTQIKEPNKDLLHLVFKPLNQGNKNTLNSTKFTPKLVKTIDWCK